jgi:hypothetical protein
MKALSGTDSSMPAPPSEDQPTRHQTKLTPEAVLDIWSRRDSQADYVARYGISRGAVQAVQVGRSWRWLTSTAPAPAMRIPAGPRKQIEQAAERKRAVLDLRAQGMEWQDVADALGITIDAAKNSTRAKRRDSAA